MWTETESLNDVLSLVLSRARLASFITCSFDLGGAWTVEFPSADALRFKFITRGECWLTVEGEEESPHRLGTGDCFLVSPGRSFILSKERAIVKKERAEELAANRRDGRAIVYDGGGDTVSVGAVFRFHGHFAKVVLDSIPPVILIPAHLDQAAILRWSLDRFAAEHTGARAGRGLMMEYLAPIILLQTLRIHLGSTTGERSWLVALSHPKLSKAIEAIHAEHRKNWTLHALATIAGMSRASFAAKFKEFIGITPIEYLNIWRMQIACDLLQQGDLGIAEVSNSVGYESESAFSAAFKRNIGMRPGQFQKSLKSRMGDLTAIDTSAKAMPSDRKSPTPPATGLLVRATS